MYLPSIETIEPFLLIYLRSESLGLGVLIVIIFKLISNNRATNRHIELNNSITYYTSHDALKTQYQLYSLTIMF